MPSIDPTREDFKRLTDSIAPETPVVMLNLLRFRERAQYPARGEHAACSGREAYARYAQVAQQKVRAVGGEPVWMAAVLARFIGPEDENWDEMLLVRYPSLGAFLTMLAMPDYQIATVHRTAALADSRLLVTRAP